MIKTRYSTIVLLLSFIALFQFASAQIPPGYYDDAAGLTGIELKDALHDIIKNHDEPSYDDLRDFILKASDEDPDNPNNVILLYSGISRPKSMFGGNSGDWNREHVWAKSHGDFGNNPPSGTDAHHIRPTDVQINSIRGNLDFDNGGDPVSGAPGCYKDGDSFEPRDAVKGDVARMVFYMDVRYEGDNGELDLTVVDAVNTAPAPELGKLSVLLEWHQQDPPDDFERNRNNVVYSYQENRNPFIDHPEFVEEIWGHPSSISVSDQIFVSCYPNPVNNRLFVEYSYSSMLTYSLLSFDGKQVLEGQLQADKSTINTSNIGNGLFVLLIKNENNVIIKQLKVLKITR
ncbi:MAG: endonuclease [Bacteroidetes bacterium]|nr:endonuclease [Bacteroidota bacterium]